MAGTQEIIGARFAIEVTPDDDNDLDYITRAVYVGGAGDLTAILEGGGEAVTFTGVQAGVIYPLRVRRVMETTTATAIVGLL
jgi:hypothetical protein